MQHSRPLFFLLAWLCILALPPLAWAQLPGAYADRAEMIELGRRHASAEALYAYFREQAGDTQPLTQATLPDWSGIYSLQFTAAGLAYDSAQKPNELPTAKLVPEYYDKLVERVEQIKQGIEFDPLGRCEPPGAPRGVSEPFLREYAVTPDKTWLINEVAAETRRIYTDGRGHLPPEDRFPTFDGDSIGFWDGPRLVIHTNQLRAGMYQRGQPDYSDDIELVEIMQKADERTLISHIWAYDPQTLLEPWYTMKTYIRLTDPERILRIHYWYCFDNQNNDVQEQDDGSTTFTDFNFD
ncbi:MAG: hypothetical protein RQ899_03875 [Pseudomonadales bacterium]|nr:hypothetical protein [Pseudomonadales bacterium]